MARLLPLVVVVAALLAAGSVRAAEWLPDGGPGFLAGATVSGSYTLPNNLAFGNQYVPANAAQLGFNIPAGNTVSPDNVPITDYPGSEFVLSYESEPQWLNKVDITTRGSITISHIRTSAVNTGPNNINPFNIGLISSAFSNCRIATVTSNYPNTVSATITAEGAVTLSMTQQFSNNYAPYSFSAVYQLLCPHNRACYTDSGLPADGRVCAWLDPNHHKRWIQPFSVDESPLTRHTLDNEAADVLLASTSGATNKHAHCVGRCHAGHCTVSHKVKTCCRAPRDEKSYEEYAAAALQGGGSDADTEDAGRHKYVCWS